MAITNTWAVVQMDCYPQYEDKTDVVFNVHWTLTGVDGVYRGIAYGTQAVSLDPDAPFTPYADLTQEQVIGWVQDAMGPEQVTVLEGSVAQQIADQINPPTTNLPLPWGAQ